MHRHAAFERGGENVNAFVHAFMSHDLGPEKFAGVGREQDFDSDRFGARIVAGVRAGMKMQSPEKEWPLREVTSRSRPCILR